MENIDLVYSEDDNGYYWQDFDDVKQPTSQIFSTKSEAIKAKENHTIMWNGTNKMCFEIDLHKEEDDPIIISDSGRK